MSGGNGARWRLEGVEVRMVELAMRRPIGTAVGTHTRRPVVFVRVVTDGPEGWGECGALAGGTAVDPDVGVVWEALVSRIVPSALARAAGGDGHVAPAWATVLDDADAAGRFAGAALEMALVDVELQVAGRSLAEWLGADPVVDAGTLVGVPDAGSEAARAGAVVGEVAEAVARGFRRVRLKIAPGWDVVPVRAVRERFPDLLLQVDANGAYRLGGDGADDARVLAGLDPFGLACLEQPLVPGDLAGSVELRRLLATPVGLDESLTSLGRLAGALRAGACEVACLKPARLGGLGVARTAQAECRRVGVHAFLGGFFETGLGRVANAALSGLPGFDLPGDLGPPADYLVDDPFGYPELDDGRVVLPVEPGLGAGRPKQALERRTIRLEWCPVARRGSDRSPRA